MKRVILFCLSFTLITTTFAQRFQLGLKAGANISNFTGGNFSAVKKKALIGVHAGAYINFRVANFSIQPEAIISTQGAKIDSVSGSYDWKITYANIPVMAQYRFSSGIYLEAGPQVGFKISDNLADNSLEDFAKGLDLSAAAGLGFRGKAGFGIGARYTVGVSKIGDFQPANGINPDFKNGVIQASIYIPLTPGSK